MIEDNLTLIPHERIVKICQPGAGAHACRYAAVGNAGVVCSKGSSLTSYLDIRAATGDMVATGNNCPGMNAPVVSRATLNEYVNETDLIRNVDNIQVYDQPIVDDKKRRTRILKVPGGFQLETTETDAGLGSCFGETPW
jgi:hypothetical protein